MQGADRVVQRREPARAPSATNQKTWADGKQVLEWFAQLNGILNKDVYTDQGKAGILDLLKNPGARKEGSVIDNDLTSMAGPGWRQSNEFPPSRWLPRNQSGRPDSTASPTPRLRLASPMP